MSSLVRIMGVFLLTFLFFSCSRDNQLRNAAYEIKSNPILFPDSLYIIEGKDVDKIGFNNDGDCRLIVFIDSAECSTCRISALESYNNLIDVEESSAKLLAIIEPTSSGITEPIKFTTYLDFPFNVYIDKEYEFRNLNPIMAENEICHVALIDENGIPVFLGDPFLNNDLMDLFITAQNNMS